jgi:hypothetical protein
MRKGRESLARISHHRLYFAEAHLKMSFLHSRGTWVDACAFIAGVLVAIQAWSTIAPTPEELGNIAY